MSVVKQIWDFEGFCVEFKEVDDNLDWLPYNINEDGSFRYTNRYNGNNTVTQWLNHRIQDRYGRSRIIVLNGDGQRVMGKTLIRNVRNSYNSYDFTQMDETDDYDDEEE